jgi:hypothetical protein
LAGQGYRHWSEAPGGGKVVHNFDKFWQRFSKRFVDSKRVSFEMSPFGGGENSSYLFSASAEASKFASWQVSK